MIGQTVKIEVKLGLKTIRIKAVVTQRLQNDEYILEGENGNRYIRKFDGSRFRKLDY